MICLPLAAVAVQDLGKRFVNSVKKLINNNMSAFNNSVNSLDIDHVSINNNTFDYEEDVNNTSTKRHKITR